MTEGRRGLVAAAVGMAEGRRGLVAAVAGCAGGAALTLYAAAQTWTVHVQTRPAPLPDLRTPETGSVLASWLPALAFVALAGAGALVATRRAARFAVGALLVAVGLGIVAGGGYGLLGVPDIHPGGPLACLAGGLVIAGAGALTIRRHPSWPVMGARYERHPAPTRSPDTPAGRAHAGSTDTTSAWDALDRGDDPTRDPT